MSAGNFGHGIQSQSPGFYNNPFAAQVAAQLALQNGGGIGCNDNGTGDAGDRARPAQGAQDPAGTLPSLLTPPPTQTGYHNAAAQGVGFGDGHIYGNVHGQGAFNHSERLFGQPQDLTRTTAMGVAREQQTIPQNVFPCNVGQQGGRTSQQNPYAMGSPPPYAPPVSASQQQEDVPMPHAHGVDAGTPSLLPGFVVTGMQRGMDLISGRGRFGPGLAGAQQAPGAEPRLIRNMRPNEHQQQFGTGATGSADGQGGAGVGGHGGNGRPPAGPGGDGSAAGPQFNRAANDAYFGLIQTVAATSEAVHALVNLQSAQGANQSTGRSDQGYRNLKPKKDLQRITASDAKTLMIELADFEVDLGELGIPVQSEPAYRQLRAQVQGRAKDVIDLELVRGEGLQLKRALDWDVEYSRPNHERDREGALLYRFLCEELAKAVRLTADKRLEICEELDDEAVMHNDSVAEAEAFLGRWRRARYLYHREGLVHDETAAEKCNRLVLQYQLPQVELDSTYNSLHLEERRQVKRFLQKRVSKSVSEDPSKS